MTMYALMAATRRLVNIERVAQDEERINEIARRTNAGQTESTQGQATESTDKHTR